MVSKSKISLVLVVAGVTLISCNASKEIPTCIQQKIESIKAEEVRNPPAIITQFEYNGQVVFYIPAYCCDRVSELFDSQCKLLCYPDGGFTGKGDGKCADFEATRKNEKVIWEDDRK